MGLAGCNVGVDLVLAKGGKKPIQSQSGWNARERESSVLEQSFQIKERENFQMREREKGWRIEVEKRQKGQKGQKGIERSKVWINKNKGKTEKHSNQNKLQKFCDSSGSKQQNNRKMRIREGEQIQIENWIV